MARGYVWCLGLRLFTTSDSFYRSEMFDTRLMNDVLLSVGRDVRFMQTRSSSNHVQPPVNKKAIMKQTSDSKSCYPYEITEEQENIITQGDSEEKMKLYSLLLLLSIKRERGDMLPEALSVKEVIELLDCTEAEIDAMLWIYQSRCEKDRQLDKLKKIKTFKSLPKISDKVTTDKYSFLNYGCYQNNLLLPPMKTSQSLSYNTNMAKGLLFGQNVVFDCSFDNYMDISLFRETARDLNGCIRLNRRNRRPFAISFCNVEGNSQVMRHLRKENPAIGHDVPVNIHACSYLDLFRREDIVYLSPYVNRELVYHPDDVLVLGALGNIDDRLSIKKAKLERIRCARLPVGFKQLMKQNPVLSIFEVFETLLAKKNTGNWAHARKLNRN